MERRNFLTFAALSILGFIPFFRDAFGQRGGRSGGGRSGGSKNNRSSSSRSGSSNKNKSQQSKKSSSNKSGKNKGGRNSHGRRSVNRHGSKSKRHRSRNRSRRRSRSRRYRGGRWGHHRCWHHRRWYRGAWVGLVFITVAVFATIAASSQTYTYSTTTYYHYNPWYRKVIHEGDEGYALCGAPIGHRSDDLPDGAETLKVESKTYYYADWSFWEQASDGGYVVVQAPVGAEVSTLPEEATKHTEGEVVLYQFDDLYFTEAKNSAGKKVFQIEPQPAEEEIDSIPKNSVSFVADGETYYYVEYSFYVEYEENGKTGFVEGDPDIGAQVDKLPEGATTLEEDGVTYYQFDTVFFEEVEADDGTTFYEVVGSPDGSDEDMGG